MPLKGQLTKKEKMLKEKKLDKALELLQSTFKNGKIVNEPLMLESLIMITAILVQFVRDHEHRFLSILDSLLNP